MKLLRVTSMVLLGLAATAGSASAQAVADHLKCFKVKDPLAKAEYTADLEGLLAESGCELKVPAKFACVPSTKTNVTPSPPGGGSTGTPNAFACYKIKCPKAVAPILDLSDQFGTRTMIVGKSQLLCAPAPAPAPITLCTQPFEPVLGDALAIFEVNLDGSGNAEVPVSCGGSPSVCCPGGTPTTPCGPLHFELVSASITEIVGQDRLDVSYVAQVTSVAGIPVNIPLVGDCLLHVDTTPGPTATVQYYVSLQLSADHLDVIGTSSPVLIGLTDEDVTLSGSFACDLANSYVGLSVDLLADQLAAQFQFPDLCRLCDGTISTECSAAP